MPIFKDFERLEDLLHVFGECLDIRDYLERSSRLVVLKHEYTVSPYEASDELTGALSEELGHGLALALEWNFKVNLTLSGY